MLKKLPISLLIFLTLLISSLAFSEISYTAILDRCSEQNLNPNEGEARNNWAWKCFPDAREYIDFFSSKKPVKYALVQSASSGSWQGPTQKESGCGDWQIKSFCIASCYTPEQKLLFASGYISIKEALERDEQTLMVLSKNSTFENPVFRKIKVAFYSRSTERDNSPNSFEIIRNIKTQNGGELRITENHPILLASRKMIEARDLQIGDFLIRSNGETDQISEIRDEEYKGLVYNLAPESEDPIENIVIAQDFLNGSANYQSDKQLYGLIGEILR